MFQERIRDNYSKLTPGFRRVADFIANNTMEAAFLTAGELARRVNADPATVVRFSQEIGYLGYRELSREIKNYVQDQITISYPDTEDAQPTEALIHSLHENLVQNLQIFFATETPTLVAVLKTLIAAPHVWVAGEFLSHTLAQMLAKELNLAGIPATALEPSMTETSMALNNMQAGEVLFAIAVASAGVDTGYAVKLAREKGLKTICLTSLGTGLPAREAELVLVTPIKSPTGFANFEVATLLVSFIWEALNGLQQDKVAEAFTQVFDNIAELRGYRAETQSYDVTI